MSNKGIICLILSTVFAAAAVGSVIGSSGVKESNDTYSCCGRLELKFKPHCENTFSVNGKTIAYSDDTVSECVPPCRTIADGLMTLDTCEDVDVIERCPNSMKIIVEERIHYHSQPCSPFSSTAMENQRCVWLLLLAVVIAAWIASPPL